MFIGDGSATTFRKLFIIYSHCVISNRTWTLVLQIFMHKSMQMQLQQRGGGAASVGSSSFSSSGGLEISKPHQCQQCLKSFSSNHQLVQHIRVHTGEKPYKCSYCERRFKQLSHVQQHTRLHTGKNSAMTGDLRLEIDRLSFPDVEERGRSTEKSRGF